MTGMPARSAHIAMIEVSVNLGGSLILDSVDLSIAAGERVGLIGENGSGKTTLLRVMAGELEPTRGRVRRQFDGALGYLPQEPAFRGTETVAEVIAEAYRDVAELASQMHDLEQAMVGATGDQLAALLAEYGAAVEEFERRDGWEVSSRTGKMLGILGLDQVSPDRPVATLSGGERARLALARLVLARPQALLLDEPTNHLDDVAADWLATSVSRRTGPCLIASHDRTFLRAVATEIVDIDGSRGKTVQYSGGFDAYLAERAVARRRWQADHTAWRDAVQNAQFRIEHAQRAAGHHRPPRDNDKAAYKFFGGKAQRAVSRATQSAQQELRRLLSSPVPTPPDPLRFQPPYGDVPPGEPVPARASDKPLLAARDIRVGNRLSVDLLELSDGDRLLIVGPSGAGKTTLLRVLAGELTPDCGSIAACPGLRRGYLPEDTAIPSPGQSLAEIFASATGIAPDTAADCLLAQGLFSAGDLAVPAAQASAGQRRRLALAVVMQRRPDVLLLDEPTNHLSPSLVEQLEEAIEEFPGPVVMVSRDRSLRERFAHSAGTMTVGKLRLN